MGVIKGDTRSLDSSSYTCMDLWGLSVSLKIAQRRLNH